MDNLKIGQYIQNLRKTKGLSQRQLADQLNISFQAVSKWENGDSIPDTGILLELCELLDTTVDKLLHGGTYALNQRKQMHVEEVMEGFRCMEMIGKCFGEHSTFYEGMIEGINKKMNIDLLQYLKDPKAREAMYAEVLIQGIMEGKTVDMDEVRSQFQNQHMIDVIEQYLTKTNA
ncbi:MAG: helix-turn-helix transcriptional regulator [Erysipelotrichaceae bacterium]|nr:helix-turn-helix transcriptional regulator [Erysipelotrichaceae bacterium]